MAALICSGAGAQQLTRGLDEVVEQAVGDYGVDSQAELHGYELFQGERWWDGVPVRARIAVYGAALDVIGEHCETIILRGIHSAGLRERYKHPEEPHSLVLLHLLERINEYGMRHQEHLLVIADEVGEQARHRSDLALYRRRGTWGYRSAQLTQIVDTLHFAPSHASRLLQAVDLVVFLYRRIQDHTETDARAARANSTLWRRIEDKISHEDCWYPIPGYRS